jgi:hypothetical protein
MIKKVTIYGERCSGTNYLENLLVENFDVEMTWKYGHKHFFGFQDNKLLNSNDTLFVCIVRDIYEWMNSLYRKKHHLPIKYMEKTDEEKIKIFLNDEWFSVNDKKFNYKKWDEEIMQDRNIYTKKRYKNIFEMRHTKIKFLLEDLPLKVKNHIFIRYEDLINNFSNTMKKIEKKGLQIKNKETFPRNIQIYKKDKNKLFDITKKKKEFIDKKMIFSNKNFIKFYEKKLGYYK